MADPQAAPQGQKVGQSVIDSIKSMGMAKALKQYTSGSSAPEFKTAMERYYSPQRLAGASKVAMNPAPGVSTNAPATTTPSAPKAPKAPITPPASAQAVATRRLSPTEDLSAYLGGGKPKTSNSMVSVLGKMGGSQGSGAGGSSSILPKPAKQQSAVQKDYARLYPGKA